MKQPRRYGILTRRVVVSMILVSTVFSAIASAAQLYFSYQRNVTEAFSQTETVKRSFVPGLENALWEFNFEQIDVLLDSVVAQPNIAYAVLVSSTGQEFRRGDDTEEGLQVEWFELRQASAEMAFVGSLEIGVSLASARRSLLNQFFEILASNMIKTLLAAIAMAAVFEFLVGRPLKDIAAHVRARILSDGKQSLSLDRNRSRAPDELDDIVDAFNSTRARIDQQFEELQDEVKQREVAEDALRQQSDQLANTNRNLIQTNREQAEFTYAISHDLKSPTTTMAMLLDEIVTQDNEVLPQDVKFLIENTIKTNQRMRQLIEDLLQYSITINANMAWAPIELSVLLNDIIADLRAEITDSNAQINIAHMPDIIGDEFQIGVLFRNLLSNAIKFRRPDVAPIITIKGRLDRVNQVFELDIEDNGIGIDPEHVDTVFKLFGRLNLHRDYDGTGLGLTLCQRVVNNHNGTINVYPVPGGGTHFHVELEQRHKVNLSSKKTNHN